MSLKDSLDSARARADYAKQEAEKEKIIAQNFQKALATCVDRALRDAAAAAYQSICDRIADEIYGGKGASRLCAEGYIELPDRLRVCVDGLQNAHAIQFASPSGDIELCPEADGKACSVRLTKIRREELFWGYRKYLELTQSGTVFVNAVRRRAANEGVSIRTYVIEEATGSEPRYIEMSQSEGTARCTGSDGITCRLALRYRFRASRGEGGAS